MNTDTQTHAGQDVLSVTARAVKAVDDNIERAGLEDAEMFSVYETVSTDDLFYPRWCADFKYMGDALEYGRQLARRYDVVFMPEGELHNA